MTGVLRKRRTARDRAADEQERYFLASQWHYQRRRLTTLKKRIVALIACCRSGLLGCRSCLVRHSLNLLGRGSDTVDFKTLLNGRIRDGAH